MRTARKCACVDYEVRRVLCCFTELSNTKVSAVFTLASIHINYDCDSQPTTHYVISFAVTDTHVPVSGRRRRRRTDQGAPL